MSDKWYEDFKNVKALGAWLLANDRLYDDPESGFAGGLQYYYENARKYESEFLEMQAEMKEEEDQLARAW